MYLSLRDRPGGGVHGTVARVATTVLLIGTVIPEPRLLWLAAAGLAGGALIGFGLSRTVGLFGFVERGLQPAPQALLSILAETAVFALAAASFRRLRRGSR